MFDIFCRIRDKHKKKVAAIAILTDKSDKFRPGLFEEELLDTVVRYSYPTIKLKDYQPDELLKGNNPFGIVLQVAWYHLYGSRDDQQKLANKVSLARRLFAMGLSAEDTRMLYDFIKYYTTFKESENYSIFDNRMHSEFKEEVSHMELRDHILWAVREEGKDEGIALGEAKGLAKGEVKGEAKKALTMARAMLLHDEPDDKIRLYTGLSDEAIQQLKNEM
ncbi:MAG: hypothetical protein AAGI66_10095 [Cyanobacteria bacterium P01_H01_bin.74]